MDTTLFLSQANGMFTMALASLKPYQFIARLHVESLQSFVNAHAAEILPFMPATLPGDIPSFLQALLTALSLAFPPLSWLFSIIGMILQLIFPPTPTPPPTKP